MSNLARSKTRIVELALCVSLCGGSLARAQAAPNAPAPASTAPAPSSPASTSASPVPVQSKAQPTAAAQATATPGQTPSASAQAPQGGTIRGSVVAGTAGKAGAVPLPGVSVTATNTLTGRKYTTATDIDGAYKMAIPRNGRYVVRVELVGFAAATQEVVITGVDTSGAAAAGIAIVAKPTDFGVQLASRAAAAEAVQTGSTGGGARRGVQSLNLNLAAGSDTESASIGEGNTGVAPSLAGLGDGSDAADNSIVVNGQAGTTNALAGYSEDEIRQRVEDGVAQARASGMLPQGVDPTNMIVGVLGGMMNGVPGGGGPGGGGGGRGGRGGGGGGGGGFGNFRNFNPAQPHGSIFYQGGNNALNSAPWQPSLIPVIQPAGYSNRFGVTLAASPYIPHLTKPDTRQFVFINFTGQKNLNPYTPAPGRVPTALERTGDFSQSFLGASNNQSAVQLYDPVTGQPILNNNLANASVPISAQAKALLAYYPAPNIPLTAQGYNYQTVSNAGSNNVAINTRYVRTIGQNVTSPFGRGGGGGGRRGQQNQNAPPTLRQNINVSYNYSHSATDQRNIFLPLGGATESDGNSLNVGYTIGYGRLSNNASLSWNRNNAEQRNYFTNTQNNPNAQVGLTVPNNTGGFADPNFYNGLATVGISNYQTLSNYTPSQLINQTISFSDFVSWRDKKHNFRFGGDIRRVHADSIGGNNPLGSFTFTGYATASPADQVASQAGQPGHSGDSFADFLLGLPESTSVQAGLFKTYLRENVYDWYATDDWRLLPSLTVNAGIRYEYFGPYSEKNNRLTNLYPNVNGATSFVAVTPGGGNPAGLVNPDDAMYAPRIGLAYRPRNKGLTKNTVLRGGYGINYNTGQYATFARNLSHQPPFAATQSNDAFTPTQANPTPSPTGCTTTQSAYTYTGNDGATHTRAATTANMALGNGFGCSNTTYNIQNNWAVDRNYRLGMVQVYNLNIQRTFPLGLVFNLGYQGSKGSNLDVVGSPNATPSGVTTATIAPFDFEESAAGSHANAMVVSLQKRQQKGISLGATYTYSHTIDNASGVGGGVGAAVQNLYRLDLEEGNSSFDQRHNLAVNWTIELPFGPNRAFLNKGGFWAHTLDGFVLSGNSVFASGTYFTPTYSGNEAEATSGNTYTQRPNRVFTQPLKGAGSLAHWFNTSAFAAPAAGQYGTASQGSIEGPGTLSTSASLSRIVNFGETRSLEARVTATNVFNTVQYSGINVVENSATFGEVTSAAQMRTLLVQARYRF